MRSEILIARPFERGGQPANARFGATAHVDGNEQARFVLLGNGAVRVEERSNRVAYVDLGLRRPCALFVKHVVGRLDQKLRHRIVGILTHAELFVRVDINHASDGVVVVRWWAGDAQTDLRHLVVDGQALDRVVSLIEGRHRLLLDGEKSRSNDERIIELIRLFEEYGRNK